MSGKIKENSIAKIVISDVLITVLIFLVIVMIIAALVDAAVVSIESLDVMVELAVLVSSVLSVVITTAVLGKNLKAIIISTAVLVIICIAIPLCQKGSGVSVQKVIITATMIAVGGFIPSVIKRGRKRTGIQRKRKKR